MGGYRFRRLRRVTAHAPHVRGTRPLSVATVVAIELLLKEFAGCDLNPQR